MALVEPTYVQPVYPTIQDPDWGVVDGSDFTGNKRRPRPPPKRRARSNPLVTLGEVRIREIKRLLANGQKPLKVDDQGYYNPYYIPEKCVVCGRDDIGLHSRNSGLKCVDCLGISAKPILVEGLTYSYNPNRYLKIPEHLIEEVYRHPHRTLRFVENPFLASAVHPSLTRTNLTEPYQVPNRAFTNYPPAAIPPNVQSFPRQVLASDLGTPEIDVSAYEMGTQPLYSIVPAKTIGIPPPALQVQEFPRAPTYVHPEEELYRTFVSAPPPSAYAESSMAPPAYVGAPTAAPVHLQEVVVEPPVTQVIPVPNAPLIHPMESAAVLQAVSAQAPTYTQAAQTFVAPAAQTFVAHAPTYVADQTFVAPTYLAQAPSYAAHAQFAAAPSAPTYIA